MDRPEREKLGRENQQLRENSERLERENERLRREIEKLKEALEQALRAAKRQAAPFSKGEPKEGPKRPGRKPGANYGPKAHREVPKHVDEVVSAKAPRRCPYCGDAVEVSATAPQYQSDIPPVRPHTVRFDIELGKCRGCGRAVRGRHPRQNSEALGAAGAHIGPRAMALAVHLNKELGLSMGKVSALCETAFGLQLSRGAVAQVQARVGNKLRPSYAALVEAVGNASVVSPDETGWRVGGHRWWLWAFVSRLHTVYAIMDGRGFEQATRVLPSDYAGTLARDGWAPYRSYAHAEHQTCLAHLLRRCRELIEVSERGAARVPHAVVRILKAALRLRDRRDAGLVGEHGLKVATGRLGTRMDRLLDWRPYYPPNRKLLRHLRTERDALFTFLSDPEVPATNHHAERAIRPAVVTRKVWGGNRTWNGAHAQQVAASVLRTARQQRRDPLPMIEAVLRSPRPVILPLEGLGPSPPPA